MLLKTFASVSLGKFTLIFFIDSLSSLLVLYPKFTIVVLPEFAIDGFPCSLKDLKSKTTSEFKGLGDKNIILYKINSIGIYNSFWLNKFLINLNNL